MPVGPGDPINGEDLIFSAKQGCVFYKSARIPLSSIPFQVLQRIHAGHPNFVSNEELRSAVWHTSDRDPNLPQQHVTKLNKVLPPFGLYIHSVPNLGYLIARSNDQQREMDSETAVTKSAAIFSKRDFSKSFLLTREEINHVVGSVEERLKTATKEIWISGNDNMLVAKALSGSLCAALDAGRRIKLLGVDPDCPAAAMLTIIDPRFSRDPFKGEVDFVTETARRWKDKYVNFEYRLLPLLPAIGYFITDPELESRTVKIELYTAQPWEPLDSRPHIVIPESMPEWRDYFIQQFKNYWNLSKTPW